MLFLPNYSTDNLSLHYNVFSPKTIYYFLFFLAHKIISFSTHFGRFIYIRVVLTCIRSKRTLARNLSVTITSLFLHVRWSMCFLSLEKTLTEWGPRGDNGNVNGSYCLVSWESVIRLISCRFQNFDPLLCICNWIHSWCSFRYHLCRSTQVNALEFLLHYNSNKRCCRYLLIDNLQWTAWMQQRQRAKSRTITRV